jgi:hypothetical protein
VLLPQQQGGSSPCEESGKAKRAARLEAHREGGLLMGKPPSPVLETFHLSATRAILSESGLLKIWPLGYEGWGHIVAVTNTMPLHKSGHLLKLLNGVDAFISRIPFGDAHIRRRLLCEFNAVIQEESVKTILDSEELTPASRSLLVLSMLLQAPRITSEAIQLILPRIRPVETYTFRELREAQNYIWPQFDAFTETHRLMPLQALKEDHFEQMSALMDFLLFAEPATRWEDFSKLASTDYAGVVEQVSDRLPVTSFSSLPSHAAHVASHDTSRKLRAALSSGVALYENKRDFRLLMEHVPLSILERSAARRPAVASSLLSLAPLLQEEHVEPVEKALAPYVSTWENYPTRYQHPWILYGAVLHTGGLHRLQELALLIPQLKRMENKEREAEYQRVMAACSRPEDADIPLDLLISIL